MKYIDTDRLRAELEKRLKNTRDYMNGAGMKYKGPKYFKAQGKESAYDALLNVLTSLQQEQPESSKGKLVFPNFLYARTVDNKTIDVSYAPQSMDAVEYIKNDPIEQPEVDLEKEIDRVSKRYPDVSFAKLSRIAVHFAKWKEAQDQEIIELAEEHAYLAGSVNEREKMMKEAVEGYVTLTLTGVRTVAATIKGEDNIGPGDKVRVIVLKED